MTALHAGELAPPFELPRAGGGRFESRSFAGRRWMLSFHRYAT